MSLKIALPLFWVGAAIVAYAYLFYPVLVAVLAKIFARPVAAGRFSGSVSVVIAAHNEQASIVRRLDELTRMLDAASLPGEVIVVSDGSTDDTVALARSHDSLRVRVLALDVNGGKAAALSQGCAAATSDILVFADARQHWADDALRELVNRFVDPRIGAVSGELVISTDDGLMSGVGLYWRYEKWLRNNEGRLHSTVGVSGSICAVRRELFTPIPKGTLLDDLFWPMCVALKGFRVVHVESAIAYDKLPAAAADEFRRKVRTLSGNFQMLALLPAALNPLRNPIWLQFVSHKLMRLIVPWALIVTLLCSAVLPGLFYKMAFVIQVLFYAVGIAGLLGGSRVRSRIASAAGSFIVLNAAAWMAFWVWVSGGAGSTWRKVDYTAPAGK